jgi:dsDNA-binding SOS-regulon protein
MREMRRSSDQILSEKDREIADIRNMFTTLEQDYTSEVNRFDDKLLEQEREFNALLQRDIAEEKRRLTLAGVSEAEITEQMAAYEQRRFAYYRSELEKYRQSIEEERSAVQARYQALQDEYQESLKVLNDERRHIQGDTKQQEIQFRLDMERTPLAPAPSEDLAKAQTELDTLNEKRRQASLEDAHVIGMFNSVRSSLEEKRYDEGLAQTDTLLRYLQSPAQSHADPAQRNLDIFLAEAFRDIARNGLRQSDTPGESAALQDRIGTLETENFRLVESNGELQRIYEAQQQQNAGEISALQKQIAGLQAENADRAATAQAQEQNFAERQRQNAVELAVLQEQIATLGAENARLVTAAKGQNEGLTEQSRQNMAEIAELRERLTGRESEKMELVDEAEARYQDFAGLQRQNAAELAALQKRLAALEAENARLASTASTDTSDPLRTRIMELEAKNSELTRDYNKLSSAMQRISTGGPSLSMALRRISSELNKTQPLADAYQKLVDIYASYPSMGLSELRDFLNRHEVQEAFPGLAARFDQLR